MDNDPVPSYVWERDPGDRKGVGVVEEHGEEGAGK